MLKDQLFKTSRSKFDNRLFRAKRFVGLSRNKPLGSIALRKLSKGKSMESAFLLFILGLTLFLLSPSHRKSLLNTEERLKARWQRVAPSSWCDHQLTHAHHHIIRASIMKAWIAVSVLSELFSMAVADTCRGVFFLFFFFCKTLKVAAPHYKCGSYGWEQHSFSLTACVSGGGLDALVLVDC